MEHEPFSSELLKDPETVTEALLDCIRYGDTESFREVLAVHLETVNKAEFARKTGIGRRTIYDLIDPETDFNPRLSTVSAIMEELEEERKVS